MDEEQVKALVAAQVQQMQQSMEAQFAMKLAEVTKELEDARQKIAEEKEMNKNMMKIAAKLASKDGPDDIVDGKGVGQPFKLTGKKDQDFHEWDHKTYTFVISKLGEDFAQVLKWSKQQRVTIVPRAFKNYQVGYEDLFGEDADELDRIENLSRKVTSLYAYLTSFTTGTANKVVRNAGDGNGLEAWRRLHSECDPKSSIRRTVVLGQVQNPPKCSSVEQLGLMLEDWLEKKKQYESFTGKDGKPCTVSEDTLIAALYRMMPASLEEAALFGKNEDEETFEDLFDKLSSYANTKSSLQVKDKPVAPAGGRNAEASSLQNQNARCWICGKIGHMGKDCWQNKDNKAAKGKGDKSNKGKSKGAQRPKNGACFNCGGSHFARDCPKGKAKGKGKKGKAGKKGKGGGKHEFQPLEDGWWGYDSGDSSWWQSGENWQEHTDQDARQQPSQTSGGKGAEDANSLAGVLNFCSLDISAVDRPHYMVNWQGCEWVRLNYDTGATAFALPVEFGENVGLRKESEFTVANGSTIAKYSDITFPVEDEQGNIRKVKGAVTEVHKPLASGAVISKHHDSFVMEHGGVLIPRCTEISKGMRKELKRLVRIHGDAGLVPLYREGNLYNFYVRKTGPSELAPMDRNVGGPSSSQPSSGNSRQELQP